MRDLSGSERLSSSASVLLAAWLFRFGGFVISFGDYWMRCWVVVGSGLMYALDRCVFLLIDFSPMDMLPTAMFPRPMCVPLDQYFPPDARAFVLLPRQLYKKGAALSCVYR